MKIRVYGLTFGDSILHEGVRLDFKGIHSGWATFIDRKKKEVFLREGEIVELVGSTLPSRDEWIKRAIT